MNNTTVNTLNSDNSNIAKIKTQHRQIMATITNGILKFEPMIKIPIVANYTFLLLLPLATSIPSLNQFHLSTTFIRSICQTKKLNFIRPKTIVIKIIYHLCISSFISSCSYFSFHISVIINW